MKRLVMYNLIIRNNATNESYAYSGLTNTYGGNLYLKFDHIELNVPDGEYTYAVYGCDRNDVTYDFKAQILDTIIHTGDGDVELRDLNPRIGILRIGDVVRDEVNYNNNHNETFYYEG